MVGFAGTVPPDPRGQEIAGAYAAAIDAARLASATSNSSVASLDATHADPILTRVRDRLNSRNLIGQAVKLASPSLASVTILSVAFGDDGAATVDECVVDDGVVFEVSTGKVINDRVVTQRRQTVLKLSGGAWKVSDRINQGEWDGVTACAASL